MRIVIFGATGRIGARILDEALARGHAVTAALRDPARLARADAGLARVVADVIDAGAVARAAAGQDAVVSAIGPGAGGDAGVIVAAARALIAALQQAGPPRLLLVGGAGTLEIRPGVQRIDTPDYPDIYRPMGVAQKEALALCRASTLDWTYLSPPVIIEPGSRSGSYRVGGDQVLADASGRSRISMEDYAVAMLDEIEQPRHRRARFTVAD